MNTRRFSLVITGPIGAGKSTLARRLANDCKCIDIDIEVVNRMLVPGFHKHTTPDNTEELIFDKWEESGDVIGILAKHFMESGYSLVIHGHVNKLLLEKIESMCSITHKILLLPSLQSAIDRDKERSSKIGHEAVRHHYEYFRKNEFEGFMIIDSSNQNEIETLEIIKKFLDKGTFPATF